MAGGLHLVGAGGDLRPMRLLVVGYLPPRTGGAAMSLGQILGRLASAGAELVVIAPITAETMQGPGDWFAARHPAMRVLRYLMPAYHLKTYEPLPADMAELEHRQIMTLGRESGRAFKPDLVIAAHESTGGYARALASELGLPWCQMLRGSPTGQILGGRFAAERVELFLDQLRAADRIIAVSHFMADGLGARFDIAGVRTVPNAIDLDRFKPMPAASSAVIRAKLDVEPGSKIIVAAGSLIGRKRPLDILRAALAVVPRHPDVRFVFAGEGELEDEMRRFMETHGLARQVHLLGHVENDLMPELLAGARIAVLASEAEGMSRSSIEAMACGLPLVAAANLAACELIEDRRTGRLFPLGDVDALAAILNELLDEPATCAALGRAAVKAVADRDLATARDRYLREFGTLIEESAQAGRAPTVRPDPEALG